jgi:hypothetical protein
MREINKAEDPVPGKKQQMVRDLVVTMERFQSFCPRFPIWDIVLKNRPGPAYCFVLPSVLPIVSIR